MPGSTWQAPADEVNGSNHGDRGDDHRKRFAASRVVHHRLITVGDVRFLRLCTIGNRQDVSR